MRYWLTGIIVFFVYLGIYLYIVGQLVPGAHLAESGYFGVLDNWQELIFKQRSPFLFESFGFVSLGYFAVFLSLNLLFGVLLSTLVAANIIVSIYSFFALGLKGGRGFMALIGTIPALLSGAACCAPLLILILGIQLSATLLSAFAFLVPVAIFLLLGSLWLALKRIQSGKF